MDISRLIRKEILAQQAYAVEEQFCPVKLDANESPYALPMDIRDYLLDSLRNIELNRYPEAGSPTLRKRMAAHFEVPAEEIMVGNGSDELIQILCATLAGPSATVLAPFPTFAMYRITAVNYGYRIWEVPLDDKFDLDIEAMMAVISKDQPVLTFLSYPNNPTGNCFDAGIIEEIIKASQGVVVVDEAYFPFSRKTFLPMLKKYDNLVILRTVSKQGLAAIRVGFLLGSRTLVGELNKVRLPYNLNSLSQILATLCLDHEQVFEDQSDRVRANREFLFSRLADMKGIRPIRSDANFLFFCCDFASNRIYDCLLEQGILIKNFPALGDLRNCMRVTVGNPEENEEFIRVLQEFIAKQGV
jgi:histidinol-phosphate aminotransferase